VHDSAQRKAQRDAQCEKTQIRIFVTVGLVTVTARKKKHLTRNGQWSTVHDPDLLLYPHRHRGENKEKLCQKNEGELAASALFTCMDEIRGTGVETTKACTTCATSDKPGDKHPVSGRSSASWKLHPARAEFHFIYSFDPIPTMSLNRIGIIF
jgi:hypothetical protein